MTAPGPLLVITGPSGSGKSTLIRSLLATCPELAFSVSHTTRTIRPGEVPGRDYHFVDKGEFERMIAAGEFLEWAPVHTNLYGTSLRELSTRSDEGRPLVLDIDIQGAAAVKHLFPDRSCLVFIAPPSMGELRRRLGARGRERDLSERLLSARKWLAEAATFDFVVVNDDLARAQQELAAVYAACRSLTCFHRQRLQQLLEELP